MSTIGHPLSDLCNLLAPFTTADSSIARSIGRGSESFIAGKTPGLPTKEQCMSWYSETSGYNPQADMTWGEAFGVYRNCIIMQGIAARYALRQASSARAKEYAVQMKPFAMVAWDLVQQCKRQGGAGNGSKAKL